MRAERNKASLLLKHEREQERKYKREQILKHERELERKYELEQKRREREILLEYGKNVKLTRKALDTPKYQEAFNLASMELRKKKIYSKTMLHTVCPKCQRPLYGGTSANIGVVICENSSCLISTFKLQEVEITYDDWHAELKAIVGYIEKMIIRRVRELA